MLLVSRAYKWYLSNPNKRRFDTLARQYPRYPLHTCYSRNVHTYALYMRIYTNVPRIIIRPIKETLTY